MADRTADPYRDLAVIDARAPRFNQATVGVVALVAVLTGWWGLFALLAVQLSLGLTLGRRWCLPCVFYFEVVQPRLGQGILEDSRPPRFANQVGAVFLGAATLASALGLHSVGLALGAIVAALALLAATTGFCAGCVLYRIGAGLRGVRTGGIDRVDLAELGVAAGQGAIVQFTHPLCADCQELSRRLAGEGRAPVLVDVSRRPDLARKYGVAVVPLAVQVGPDGGVERRLAG
ncbi:MAG TPA: DUF4395 family protein [Anaeromyxobacter sp.]